MTAIENGGSSAGKSDSSMKVLVLAHHAEGLYQPRRELLESLHQKGHYVVACIPQGRCYDKVANIVDRVIETPVKRRGENPLEDIQLFIFYLRMIRQIKPDCVLSYAIKPNLYGGMAARFLRVPYLPNITGLGTVFAHDGWMVKLVTCLYKMVAGHEQCVFIQNVGNLNTLENYGIHWHNPVLLPGSGVNLRYYPYVSYPEEGEGIRFLFVSRILREKGIYELADAARIIRRKYPATEFNVLGRCEAGYEKIMQQWNDDGVFMYHGHQADVRKWLCHCHALVHPSYYPEGMSNVCLEAAATGRPVLTTDDIHGCLETIEDGKTGMGFHSRDANALANALDRFIGLSHAERENMGRRGREKMEKEFDRNLVIDAYMQQLYEIKSLSLK